MSDDHPERIAALETKMEGIQKDLAEIKPMVKETHTRVTQWGGIVTGVVITVSAIWAFILGVWQFVKHKLG